MAKLPDMDIYTPRMAPPKFDWTLEEVALRYLGEQVLGAACNVSPLTCADWAEYTNWTADEIKAAVQTLVDSRRTEANAWRQD